MQSGALEQEQEHAIGNIREQILAGQFEVLENQRLLRVFQPVPSKEAKDALKKAVEETRGFDVPAELSRNATIFPSGDYDWYECPEYNDKVYSILCPLSARRYYEGLMYKPGDYRSTGKYLLQIEEFMCNLRLTPCEARRFLQNCLGDEGQVMVLRDITRPVTKPNPRTKGIDVLRRGIRDVVMKPKVSTDELTVETVGERMLTVKGSPYSGFRMTDIPDDYLHGMANPGPGARDTEIERLGTLELERRNNLAKGFNFQPVTAESEPATAVAVATAEAPKENEEYYCSGLTASGMPCRAKGIFSIGGKLYCTQHKNQGVDDDA